MNRFLRVALGGSVVLALGAGGTAVAYTGWTVPKSQLKLSAKVAAMPRGVTPSVAKQGARAVVSWSAQEIAPGALMDHYLVTAHSVSTPPLPDVVRTVAASGGVSESVTFATDEVAGSRWYWTITPRFRLWAGAESNKSKRLTFPVVSVARPPEKALPKPSIEAVAPAPVDKTPAPAPAATSPVPAVQPPAGEPTKASPTPAVPERTSIGTPTPTPSATSAEEKSGTATADVP